ncbi:GNAT family N-acetyltransferase [Solwaraspora sp. WMMD406]|uniref:GNAT family N-acetyltransferase n=1 Tax=Solwaraspora sp. WMMD406 TaxID=3016095 RepID=UPI00241738F8|nr:GNAT family N-acetyltransferase [Solwaraspora sp. WMMD406]MDG4767112.1 GNAT family N-acetyltransferase [Solwaraspora sp. WMMD406]
MRQIRQETLEDAEAIATVHVRAWRAGYAGLIPADVLDRLNVAAWAQRRRDTGTADPDHPFRTVVAVRDNRIVGFSTFGPYRIDQDRDQLDPTYGEIVTMYVDPAHWGDGVGRELLAASVAGLAALGWGPVRLWVLAGNQRGRRFYERAGLRPDGERSVYQVPRLAGQAPVDLTELRYQARLDGGRLVAEPG